MAEQSGRHRRAAFEELLVRRAIEPLDPNEAQSVERLAHEFPEIDATGFDRAAALVWLAAAAGPEPMPPDLRQRILAQAGKTGDD